MRSAAHLMPAWRFYLNGLTFYVLVGTAVTQFLSALIFAHLEDSLDYGSALWHTWVTATTVGYGDIVMETDAMRIFATVHIFVSVSWLASLFRIIQALARRRRTDLKAAAMVANQLNEKLIKNLDQNGDGVDQMEFVFGMLRSMGAELCGEPLHFEKHVAPLIKRFEVLDADGSGKLDADDLEFMLDESKRQNPGSAATEGELRGWAWARERRY